MSKTILCLTSFEKGQAFLRECAASGLRTILLTVEKLRDADWPRDVLTELYLLPGFDEREPLLNAVSWLARTEPVARIVALDEFDLEVAAELREHLRVPGLGVTATRAVRDKLTMREVAAAAGLAMPEFTGVFHHDDVRSFLAGTRGPWLLKPRTQASAIGIRKLHAPDEVWPILDELGDRQSHHLLERYVPGDVYHADGIVDGGTLRMCEVHRYAQPPFDTMHEGGIFCSGTLLRGSDAELGLRAETARMLEAVGLADGAFHAEFIRPRDGGAFHFLEVAARVGGAHIAEMVEAATGSNPWREWARLEVARARGDAYEPPRLRRDYGGVIMSLARQEWPDTSGYTDPEIVLRPVRRHHAGLVVASPRHERTQELLGEYMRRFGEDFYASLPAPDEATA